MEPLTAEQWAQAERLRSVTLSWAFAVGDVRLGPPNGLWALVGTWQPEEPVDVSCFRAEQDVAAPGAFFRTGMFIGINTPDVGAISNPGSEATILLNTLRLKGIEFTFPQGPKKFTMRKGDTLYVYSNTALYATYAEVDGAVELYYNRRFGE